MAGVGEFLWDLRMIKESSSGPYWQSSVMQALEIKLKKTMSMMELTPQTSHKQRVTEENLSPKAREMKEWLEKSTQQEWNEIMTIRSRLEMLEEQKRKLIESQKMGHVNRMMNKTFRLRKTNPSSQVKKEIKGGGGKVNFSLILNPEL